jgi:phosphoglycolate phosphatase
MSSAQLLRVPPAEVNDGHLDTLKGMRPLIAFDLDGTLVDSRLDLAETANEMLARYRGGPLPVDTVAGYVGDGARQLVIRTLEGAGVPAVLEDALAAFLDIYSRRLLNHTRPYSGILEAVRSMEGTARLGVVTNKPEAFSREILAAFGLAQTFEWVIGGDSPFGRKPDPAGLRHVMEAAGVSPDHTLFVGDSRVDVETARRAGTKVCVAAYGFGQARNPIVLRGDEYVAKAPFEVAGILREFVNTLRGRSAELGPR